MGDLSASLNNNVLTLPSTNDSRNIGLPLWNLDYFVLSVLISVLSIIGILGNIPVLIVYIRRKDRKISSAFIKFLAFLDLLVCSLIMPYSVVYEFHLVTSDIMCRAFELLRHFSIMASNVTLVAIAIERYIAVCQIGTKISLKCIKKGILAIIVFSLLLALPAIGTFAVVDEIEVKDIKCKFPHETTTGQFCHFTFSVMGENLVLIYQIIQMSLFCIVLVVIVVLYSIIYAVLWKKTKIRKQLTRRHLSALNGPPSPLNGTFQTELTEKCKTHQETIKADVLEKSPSPTECVALKRTSNSRVLDEEPSSSETGICKTDSKVTFHDNFNYEGQNDKYDVTVTSDLNGDNVKIVPSETKKLNQNFANRDKKRKKRHYHRRTAKMLFLCTVIYFVTWLPFWLDIFGLTSSLTLRYLFFIGNASNPIVYGIVNEQVRKAIKKLFLFYCGKCRNSSKYTDETEQTLNCSSSLSQ